MTLLRSRHHAKETRRPLGLGAFTTRAIWPALGCAAVALAQLSAQTAWSRVATAANPSGAFLSAMAPNPSGGVVLFGGRGVSSSPSTWLDETWLFDGVAWRQQFPAVRPSPRTGHRMVLDSLRGRTVMVGMSQGAWPPPTDTWEWDGAIWTLVPTFGSPGPRQNFAMAYDRGRARTVLFGGFVLSGLNDTWEYDGVSWTRVPTATTPSARWDTGMAYDSDRRRIVMFGGSTPSLSAETWEYDGMNWTQRQPAVSPAARCAPAMAFDSLRSRCVLFGGGVTYGTGEFADTWEWDGVDWRQRQPTTMPPARRYGLFTWDSARDQLVLFGGGLDSAGVAIRTDTWTYQTNAPASRLTLGPGCAGSAGVPVLACAPPLPWLGEPWTMTVAPIPVGAPTFLLLGTSQISWNGVPLPLVLGPYGLPGCTLWTSGEALLLMAGNGPQASTSFRGPATTALAGARVSCQAAVVDPAANTGGLIASDAWLLTLGIR